MNHRLALLVLSIALVFAGVAVWLGTRERSALPGTAGLSVGEQARESERASAALEAGDAQDPRERAAVDARDDARAFPREHASFDTKDARWVEVLVHWPAEIRAEDAPALIALANAAIPEEGDLGFIRHQAREIDMSEASLGRLGSRVSWARCELEASGSARIPFPAQARNGLLLLQSRFFWLEPTEVDLEQASAIELKPSLGAWVSGRCVLPPGAEERGIEAERIKFTANGYEPNTSRGDMRKVFVEEDFTFELRALSADMSYGLLVAPEKLVGYAETDLEVSPGEHRVLEIPFLLGATLSGRVLGDGQPLAGADVEISGNFSFRAPTECKSAEDGAFEILGVQEGRVHVSARKTGWLQGEKERLVVADRELVTGIELSLASGRKISGSVKWPDGKPAAGARVSAYSLSERRMEESSHDEADEEGAFRIGGLEEGVFLIEAKATPANATQSEAWMVLQSEVPADTSTLVLTLQPPIAVQGHVVDDTGAPIIKFRVQARPESELHFHYFAREFESPEGAFSLEVPYSGRWIFTAQIGYDQESPEQSVLVPQAGEPLRLVLVRAGIVKGVVLDPHGNPTAGAGVTAMGDQRGLHRNAESDATGSFELELPVARATLHADHAEWAASLPQIVELTPGETKPEVVLSLRAGGRITGVVYDAEGNPESGTIIGCDAMGFSFGEKNSVTTDSQGRFAIDHVPPGKVSLFAMPGDWPLFGGMAVEQEDETEMISALGRMRTATVEVADGEEKHVVLGTKPRSPVRVHGEIRAGEAPVADAALVALAEGGSMITGMKATRSDVDGRYEITLDRPGDYVFGVSQSGFGLPGVQFYISVPEADEFESDFDLPLGSIAGRVIGPDGSGAEGVRLRVRNSGGMLGLEGMDESSSSSSDGAGRFSFENLREGSYAIFAGIDSARFGAVVMDGIEVRANLATDGIEIRLGGAGKLAGTVRDESGEPVRGAAIFVRDALGRTLAPLSSCLTDAAGSFLYEGIAPGRVTASARTDELACADSAPIEIVAGETSTLELVLARGSYLVVTLLDGEETVRARLSVTDEEGRMVNDLFSLESVEERFFIEGFSTKKLRVGPLPPGEYTLVAVSLDGKDARKPVTIESWQEERTITLRLR